MCPVAQYGWHVFTSSVPFALAEAFSHESPVMYDTVISAVAHARKTVEDRIASDVSRVDLNSIHLESPSYSVVPSS
jgi:hypothetical protein